uniref:copper chaperone for superoxide dismutase, chloroplastic/cytosolic n=1 Tax=Erigeron canadensis TaxID=72917 RepID=UPI001CB88B67|nr:copper chaperone for superoxide dismutase, chloroplastic/cytosolic [Erigeron canadensis]
MGLFRTTIASVTSTTTAIAATHLALNSISPSSSSTFNNYNNNNHKPIFSTSSLTLNRLPLIKNLTSPPFAVHMDAKPALKHDAELPEVMTEFMVDMSCEGCVKAVKNKLQTVDGIKSIDVDLSNQLVRIFGSSPVKTMAEALEQTGRKARLIGQGSPGDVLISAAVAEFKGPQIFGVVRLAQVSMELARIEANFSGLSPGKHGWSINEFGDLTRGAASTGKLFNPTKPLAGEEVLGDLGTLDVDEKGEAFFSGVKKNLKIADLIGRAIAVYDREDRSDSGLAAAVIARSAGVGENYKKLCTCDGTTIWEATNADYVSSKV